MDGPSDEIDLEAFLPRGFEHRNSEDDLWDLALALESGDEDGAIRKLTDRWWEEDRQSEIRKARAEAEAARHSKMTKATQSLEEVAADLRENRELYNRNWLSRENAARYLNVSEKTIDRRRQEGILPAYHVQGTSNIRFKRSDLDKLMHEK